MTFCSVYSIIFVLALSFDNLEVVAQSMGELLSERWPVLNINTLGIIVGESGEIKLWFLRIGVATIYTFFVGIMVDHLHAQYAAGWTGEQGADVRLRTFSALLSIHCCPITNRLSECVLRSTYGRSTT